ncbi:long-chain fatty acid transporter [Oceanisphaera profunda]|uniref:Long-chain fatty acid transporter n=1 Tax=Oceanisphaera profunda TaxID=1416627 RepID=A0A1Y0D9T1_9GAMM|nr:outer membrane protein transport protein [Oceanisphaera profunda]ART83885.1 long-chain fatty acid transporter [Oceanisphaera profunda]
MSKQILKLSLVAAAMAMATGQAHSAAFQLAEQNATGLGRAYAGEGAIGDNASVLGRNPAAMTLFDRPALSAGAIYINPDVDVEGKPTPAQAGGAALAGTPTSSHDIADDAVVPFFYYVQPVNEQWAVGFGAFTNYGLSTSYQDNHYAGPVAGSTSLKTLNLNPNIAFKANQHLSLGAGFNAVYADAELIRHAGLASLQVNGQTAGTPFATSLAPTSEFVRLKGDDWGYGWNIGLLLEADEHNRWALTYRSKVDLTLEGEYSSALPQLPGNQALAGLPVGTSGVSKPGSLDLSLPAIAEVSGFHQVQPDWALHYGIMWTEWSTFEELRALDNQGGTLFNKPEGFENSWRMSMGATHQLNDQLTLRGGLAYDKSPVPENARSISIPDVDRVWYTVGATYALNESLSMDASFAFLDGKTVNVQESGFEFESGGDAYLFGMQMNYAF